MTTTKQSKEQPEIKSSQQGSHKKPAGGPRAKERHKRHLATPSRL